MAEDIENENLKSNQNPTLVLSLNLQEVNVVISALQEIPFKLADPVLKKLVPQAQQQLKQINN